MSWKATIEKESWKGSIQQDWKHSALSIVAPVPTTKEKVKAEILSLIMPEINEKLSWKNTLSIAPKNGVDGHSGKDGKNGKSGANGTSGKDGVDGSSGANGKNGSNGVNGSTWLLFDKKPDDSGKNGDFCFCKSNFEIYFKENDAWKTLGSTRSKDKTSYVGGLNGASAYDIAVKNGFLGTESEWLASLGGAQVEMATIIDEASSTVTYVGKADPGSAEASALWQIKKITVSGTETIITFADGDANFNNVWDNRASLTYT